MRNLVLILLSLVLILSCTNRMRYSYEEIKDYPPEIQEHIKRGEVVTGMTFQQVRLAWGPPSSTKILPPSSDGKDRVQWEYPRVGGVFKTILRFTNGILTEIIHTEPVITR